MHAMQHPVLQWFLVERKRAGDLFDVDKSNGILFTAALGSLSFAKEHGCIFCFDAVLPQRAPPVAVLPKELGYAWAQPARAKREFAFVTVRSAPMVAHVCAHGHMRI